MIANSSNEIINVSAYLFNFHKEIKIIMHSIVVFGEADSAIFLLSQYSRVQSE
jgi:hypothetical protein